MVKGKRGLFCGRLTLVAICLIAVSMLIFSSCTGGGSKAEEQVSDEINPTPDTITVTDSLGREVSVVKNPERVVAGVGSYGEVWELAGGKLCGVTSDALEENRLKSVDNLLLVGTVKELNLEQIISLSPELVILSSKISSHLSLESAFENAGIATLFFSVETFEEYLIFLRACAEINDNKTAYSEYGESLESGIESIRKESQNKGSLKILFLRAYGGGVKVKNSDSMAGQMLLELNTVNIADSDTSMLEELSMEQIIEKSPDAIFISTMGGVEEAQNSIDQILYSDPAFKSLAAVEAGHCWVLPKDLFHYKPNARWLESYIYLDNLLEEVRGDSK